MELKEQVEHMEEKIEPNKVMIVWLWIEIIVMTAFVSSSMAFLWTYLEITMLAKLAITMLSGIVIYDIYATFVKVRYIFIKEG